ncbi:MAG: C1 family peptidase [Coprococcus sp.]|nr:C1 family peptidase [Coprococcus sp.]
MNLGITSENLKAFESAFDADRANQVAMNAVVNNGIHNSSRNSRALQDNPYVFSVSLKQGKITNQKESGRCWMFAALNVMRFKAMHDLNVKTFELSQAYPLFYDKLEKSNYFLNSVLETLDEPVGGRLISYLLQMPVNDGGQWDMFCNLVKKYGVVPISAYPETNLSSATREMNIYLTEKLREDACILRKHHAQGAKMEELQSLRTQMMEEIYRFLCICLGKPPKTFDFEYQDKEDGFHRDCGLTPHAFFEKYIHMNLDDYVSLINAPTADKPYSRSYTVKFLGNVKEGKKVRYLNLEIGELKKAAIAQMQDGNPVWFGCDVGKRSDRESGVMDLDTFRLEELLNTTFTMNKAERLDYGQSLMTHAMVFQGVNLDKNGAPNRWRVENSWGKEAGTEGYYVMTDRWFDEYIYQVVVNKKYLSDEQIQAYESEPIELEPWDPMGSLAHVR